MNEGRPNFVMLAAVIGYGFLERKLRSRKRVIAGGSVASSAILLVLAFLPDLDP